MALYLEKNCWLLSSCLLWPVCACTFLRRAMDSRTEGRRGPRRSPLPAIEEARRATRRGVCAAAPPCKCPSLRSGPGPAARPDRNTLSFSPSGRRCPLKSRWRRTRGYRTKCEWQTGRAGRYSSVQEEGCSIYVEKPAPLGLHWVGRSNANSFG